MTQPAAPLPALTVQALHAERFMILNDVEIRFDEAGVHLLSGQNGNGKSAVAWAIACSIDPTLAPDAPIQRGEKESVVTVDFGEFKVMTTWWFGSGPKNLGELEVKQEIQWPAGNVQTTRVADWVRGRLGLAKGDARFDPFELARLSATAEGRRKQAASLRKAVGLDLTDVSMRITASTSARLPHNQEVDRLRVLATSIVIPPAPTVAEVGEKKTVAAALGELEGIRARAKAIADATKTAEDARKATAAALVEVERLRRELIEAEANAEGNETRAYEAEQFTATLPPAGDEAAAARTLAELDAFNAAVDARQKQLDARRAAEARREEKFAEVEAATARAKVFTDQIRAAEEESRSRLASVRFPVPGLGFDGEEVTFDDGTHGAVPLAQASQAQQIRIWLALRLAQHPALRFIAVDSWSLLDDAMAEAARAWSVENGVTILAEYVPHKVKVDGELVEEQPDGLVIQFGTIIADRRPRAGATTAEPTPGALASPPVHEGTQTVTPAAPHATDAPADSPRRVIVPPLPDWQAVTSSNIAAVRHDGAETLFVRFSSGKVWRYVGVPIALYEELLAAKSVGSFFAKRIKQRNDFAASEVVEAAPVGESDDDGPPAF